MEQSPFLASIQTYMDQRPYAKRTIETCLVWIRRYINFHGKRHPNAMGDSRLLEPSGPGTPGGPTDPGFGSQCFEPPLLRTS